MRLDVARPSVNAYKRPACPMHIAFLTNEYPPLPSGGIGTNVRNLARTLVQQGHRVTVLGWGAETQFDDQGVQVHFLGHTRIPKLGWFLNRRHAAREINRLVREEQLAIVEAPDWCGMSAGLLPHPPPRFRPSAFNLRPLAFGFRIACPLVIRCNGSATYFAYLEKLQNRITATSTEPHTLNVKPLVYWTEWLALHQTNGIIAVSQFCADTTATLFSLGGKVPGARCNAPTITPISVIPNGIDVNQFAPASQEEVEPDTILYFGTLVRKKGVLDLPDIFNRVITQIPNARLRIVGRDNPDLRTGSPSIWEQMRTAFSPSARARVEYLGVKPYSDVQQYVRRAAMCVFPSYAEALPLSWMEAMACAKPVIAYDIGWAVEVLGEASRLATSDSSSGVLVPGGDTTAFADAVVTCLRQPQLATEMGAWARQRVERYFAAEVVARQSVKWYDSVCRDA